MRTPGERTSGAWTGGCAIHPDGGDETDRTAGNSYNDALRELIQNGTDQEVLDPDNEFQIDYSPKEKVLRLKNRKSVLKINTLLLGRSSKANNEDTVGQFGEGYQITRTYRTSHRPTIYSESAASASKMERKYISTRTRQTRSMATA